MEYFIKYLLVFAVGGFVCLIAQVLIIRTQITSSRILVLFVVIGALLEAFNFFTPIERVSGSGIRVPITGFGMLMTRGVIEGVRSKGFLGLLTGGLTAAAAGICVAVLSAYLMAVIFKSHTKKG